MKKAAGYCSDDAKHLIAETLRLYVGHGRALAWADLADAADLKERTLRSYADAAGNEMPLHVFIRVFTLLPPGAFARVARVMGFAASEAETEAAATIARAAARSARLAANATEAMEDGKITPREAARLGQEAAELLPVLQSLASGTAH